MMAAAVFDKTRAAVLAAYVVLVQLFVLAEVLFDLTDAAAWMYYVSIPVLTAVVWFLFDQAARRQSLSRVRALILSILFSGIAVLVAGILGVNFKFLLGGEI